MPRFAALDARLDAAVMRHLGDADCHVGQVTFRVAFERASQQVLLGDGGGIDTVRISALASVEAVDAAGVGPGTAVVIRSTAYYVIAVRPESQGLVVLELSEEPV